MQTVKLRILCKNHHIYTYKNNVCMLVLAWLERQNMINNLLAMPNIIRLGRNCYNIIEIFELSLETFGLSQGTP